MNAGTLSKPISPSRLSLASLGYVYFDDTIYSFANILEDSGPFLDLDLSPPGMGLSPNEAGIDDPQLVQSSQLP